MRILTVLTYYSPHWTGLTAHAAAAAEGLAARGHQVTVLTTRYRPDLARDEVLNRVRVIRIRAIGRFSRGMITPAFPWAAVLLIRKHDAVHIHTPLPEAALVALLCRLLGKPLLMTHHGDLVMPPGLFNRVLEWIGYALTYTAARLASGVTCYSFDYANHSKLLSHFNRKLAAVLPPVDIPVPDRRAAQEWKAELGLSGSSLIGFAGRWVSEKGFDDLLRALPLIRQQDPQAHLVFAGEQRVVYEDFYKKCRALIEPIQQHVTFLGLLLDRQQMANFYAMCDLFALPSRTDNMPLVLIEALLCGTPVVASDIPGARVVVRETGFGLLSPPADPPGLARTLIEALRVRKQLTPRRADVQMTFDFQHSLEAYEALLNGIIAPPLPRPATKRVLGLHSANGSKDWVSLTAQDHGLLDRLLGNEADMAYRRRARILMDYLELRDGERVIDIGCGMGFYLMLMSRVRRIRPVGVDRQRVRLQRAQQEVPVAQVLTADIGALPLEPGIFDKVLMTEVLEHLTDDRKALRAIHRLLRPGGLLALSVPHARYPFWWDPINRTWIGLGGRPIRQGPIVGIWTDHQRLYLPEELAERLVEAGFVVEAMEEATHYCFPFMHFLVYGIGKPLLERGLLPRRLVSSADRFTAEQNRGTYLNPINLGVAAFRMFDRANASPQLAEKRSFVNVLVKARKPAEVGG